MIFILDACSAINLLHIFKNNEELLINIFNENRIEITKKVNEEMDKNLFKNKLTLKDDEKHKILQIKDYLFKNKISIDEEVNSQNYLKETISYSKKNGEFYSTALALNLNRLENDCVIFVTDDIEAKKDFYIFFSENITGEIITTSNFLFKYFLINDKFNFVNEILFNLKVQYLNKFYEYEDKLKSLQLKYQNKKEKHLLNNLEYILKNRNIDKIVSYTIDKKIGRDIDKFINDLKKDVTNNYKIILSEINNYLKLIKEKNYYRI